MAVPTASTRSWTGQLHGHGGQALAGAIGSVAVLAVPLSLGLLAFAPLGPAAVTVGVAATCVNSALGGTLYAAASRARLPAAASSSATALILAALVLQLVQDMGPPGTLDAVGIAQVWAACGAAVALSGLLQVLLAAAGLGRLARVVPRPVLAGFMNGVALLTVLGQVPLLLGQSPGAPLDHALLAQAKLPALLLALGALVVIVLLRRHRPRWPAALIALLLGTAVYALVAVQGSPLALGPRVELQSVPWPQTVVVASLATSAGLKFLLAHGSAVLTTAAVLGLIGGLESLLSLQAFDELVEARHDPRRELLVLGGCNLVCGLLGSLPVVQSRARAMSIHQAGGRRAIAAGAGAAAVGLLLLLGMPLIAWLPLAVLGAIMVTIGWDLADRWSTRLLRQWWQGPDAVDLRAGLAVMGAVCLLTLWKGFAAGVALGVLLSMATFIVRMNRSLLRSALDGRQRPSRRIYPPAIEAQLLPLRGGVRIWELEGALFFGNADRLLTAVEALADSTRVLVLDLRRVTTIDETGVNALATAAKALQRRVPPAPVLLSGLAAGSAAERSLLAQGLDLPRWPDADRAIEAAEGHLLGTSVEASRAAQPLGHSELLRGLDPAQVETVQALMTEKRLSAGALLFRQGDSADGLYVLSQGSVSLIGHDGPSSQRYLSVSPGMMLGETAMLDGGGRSADAVADTGALLHHLSSEAIQALEQLHPLIASRLHRNIAVHLSVRLRAASLAWAASQR